MEVIERIIAPQDYFPGNQNFSLLIYKNCILETTSAEILQKKLKKNGWKNSWVDSIYDFDHYHSNTHEVLIIISGSCDVQFGGEFGSVFSVNQGDVIIIPAGVAHKSLSMTNDFKCVGAYPCDIDYDINYGKQEELEAAKESINKVGMPHKDPIFGKNGLLFNYWK